MLEMKERNYNLLENILVNDSFGFYNLKLQVLFVSCLPGLWAASLVLHNIHYECFSSFFKLRISGNAQNLHQNLICYAH